MHRKIEATFDHVLQTLEGIPEELWNHAAPSGGWSIAQVCEHMVLSASAPPDGILGEPDRLFDAEASAIEICMLDRLQKRTCPAQLYPSGLSSCKASLMADLAAASFLLSEYAQTKDLTLLCLSTKLLHFGFVTRHEWLIYICAHSNRHVQQVEEFCGKIRI